MARERSSQREAPVAYEQLALQLGEPWGGRSPRYLTRAAQTFRFAPEGMGRSIQDATPEGVVIGGEQLLLPLFL